MTQATSLFIPTATDSAVKAIFFDFDGTLRLPQPDPTEAFVEFVRGRGLNVTTNRLRQLKLWAHHHWSQDDRIAAEQERLGSDGFWLAYSRQLLSQVSDDTAVLDQAEAVRDWFYNSYEPDVMVASGIHELLSDLQAAGYRLGLITNRHHPIDEEIKRLELAHYFELVLTAGEVGSWKPNPAIFDYALRRFTDLSPADCLYIGDNYYADSVGAWRAGWLPVLFDPDSLYVDSDCHRLNHMHELRALLVALNGRPS
jgi:HAD superfamily hydrolase (TIGR01549 family)